MKRRNYSDDQLRQWADNEQGVIVSARVVFLSEKLEIDPEATILSQNASAPASDRDRLLAALMVGPRITDEEAEQIRLVVSEAREASIATASDCSIRVIEHTR